MFNVGGVKFEVVTFDFQQCAKKYKALAPGGSVPWLELEDGRVLTQSGAINLYAAHVACFEPTDPIQVARTTKVVNPLEDVFNTTLPSMNIKDAEEKMAARKALTQPDGAMAIKLKVAEKMIADLKTEYCCGVQPTLANFHLFTFLGFIRSGFLDGITVDFLESFEKMSALRSQVAGQHFQSVGAVWHYERY